MAARFLGICIGLQLLYEGSEEAPGVAGLGILPGTVQLLPGNVKRPQNAVESPGGANSRPPAGRAGRLLAVLRALLCRADGRQTWPRYATTAAR